MTIENPLVYVRGSPDGAYPFIGLLSLGNLKHSAAWGLCINTPARLVGRQGAALEFTMEILRMRRFLILGIAALAAFCGFTYFQTPTTGAAYVQAADAFPPPPSRKRQARDRDAQKVESIFASIEARNGTTEEPGPRYKITEPELNSYLSALVEKENIKAVEALFVKLRNGSFSTYAVVNVDNVPKKDKDSVTRVLMQTILAGRQYLSADGLLDAHNSLGQYTLTSARINEVEIPTPLVNTLINTAGKRQNPPFDLSKPFKLPFGIREAEIKSGYLEVS
jgi:hypothetical protein